MNFRTALTTIFSTFLLAPGPALGAPVVEKGISVASRIELRVIEAGKEENVPPIVFIPGWSASADIWSGQIQRFDRTHRIMSFDPRSQGQSTKALDGNTPEQRAEDLHALMIKEHLRRPVLVAWSQAVQDVAAYVLQYGTSNLSGIVLVDAAVSDGAKAIAKRPVESAAQFERFNSYLTSQQDYLHGMFGAIISKPQPPGTVDRAIATGMKTPPSIGLAMLVADMFTFDRTAALSRMNCPVLIIASSRSPELSLQKSEAQAIKNAQFVEIDDAAHAVFLDQPDRFAAVLTRFLNGSIGTRARDEDRKSARNR